jgi:uncharacterized protein
MDRSGTALEVGTVAALGIHNLAANHLVAAPFDAALNVIAAAALTVGARRNGIGWTELGMSPTSLPRGLALGMAASVPVVAAVRGAASVPSTRRFFHDERVTDVRRLEAFYHAAVRIPVATAVVEEVLFRGVLDAVLSRKRTRPVAGILGSLLFGAWHVLPTIRTSRGNATGRLRGKSVRVGALAGSVLATSLAGGLFLWLRRSSGSLAAPVLTHAAVNVSAYLTGLSVVKAHGMPAVGSPG